MTLFGGGGGSVCYAARGVAMSAETTKRARLFEEYPGERYDVDPFAVVVANAGVGGDERMARHAASAIRAQRQSALFVDWYFCTLAAPDRRRVMY